jgi:acetoin:2,6-dichlorophenolindophenol oxidoreductase subunit beta
MTLSTTIRSLTASHIREGGLALGQCLTAVGWVNNTVPDDPELRHGLVELPMTEGAGAGFAVGSALIRPTVLIIRFQSFLWLQASPLVNYAAKCRSIWGRDCRLWVRAIASENCGPLHSGYHDRIFEGIEGLTVVRPHTPSAYRAAWQHWQNTGNPVICSEHRADYGNADE